MKKAKLVAYEDPEKISYTDRETFANAYRKQCPDIYFNKKCPLEIRVTAYYKIPDEITKKKRMAMARGYILPFGKSITPTTLMNLVINQLANVAFEFRLNIAKVNAKALYSENPRVVVCINEMENGGNK